LALFTDDEALVHIRLAEPLALSAGGVGLPIHCSVDLPAAIVRKPEKTVLQPGQETNRIAVKFRDGLNVRLRNNVLVSANAQLFAGAPLLLFDALSAGRWERADAVSEDAIDQMRHTRRATPRDAPCRI